MKSDLQNAITKVIGFDLGDGESCLSMAMNEGTDPPEPLDLGLGGKSIVTAIGRDASGHVIVGESAVTRSDARATRITFKRAPSRDDGTSLSLAKEFFSALVERVEQKRYATAGETLYVVGHPSNWPLADRDRYARSLSGPLAPNVKAISESRAAFLQMKESKRITAAQLRSAALIVDIGSSTTDFTLLKDLHQQPIEFGHNDLGGRLLDRQLLERSIKSHAQSVQIRSLFKEHPTRYAEWELAARRLKEWYFGNEPDHRKTGEAKKYIDELDAQGTTLRLSIDTAVAEAITNEPIEELNGQSWRDSFHSTLVTIRTRLEKEGLLPLTIALTGGASRMEFTQQLCQTVFREAKLVMDSSPEFCIANGLARAGRWDQRAHQFQAAVKELCAGLPVRFAATSEIFVGEFVPLLAKGLATNVIRQGMLDWRDGKVRLLNGLEPHMESLASRWIDSSEAKSLYREPIIDWLTQVINSLRPELERLCARFGLSDDVLEIGLDELDPEAFDPKRPSIDDPEGVGVLGNVIAGITFVIVAKISALILVKIHLAAGPFAVVVAGVVAVIAALIGKEAAQDMVKATDLPNFTRKFLLWDSSIESAAQKAESAFASGIIDEIRSTVDNELLPQVSAIMEKSLLTRMERALVLIKG